MSLVMSELQNFLNLTLQLMCFGWGSAAGTGVTWAVWGQDDEDRCASWKVYHGHSGTLLKSSIGSSFLGSWGNRGILRCFSASPALQWRGAASTFGMSWLSLQLFDLNVVILCFRCPTVSDLGLTHTGGSFEIKHFPSGGLSMCEEGHGRLLPTAELCLLSPGGQVLFPLFSSSSRCAVAVGSCIFIQGCLSRHSGANGRGQGELQLQAEEKQGKALSVYCISWALQNAVLSQLRSTLSRVGLSIFSFHVLSEYGMQWALGF